MKMTALDYLTESADTAALATLLRSLHETVGAAAHTAVAVAHAADRWQENLIHDDLLKICDDLELIRNRVVSLASDAFAHSADAGCKARELIAQADHATQEN